MPFLDLRITDDGEFAALIDAVSAVFRHGRIVMGPEVDTFERRFAEYCGRRHAVGVGSGSDAVLLALLAAGIGPGDEVVTTSLSWIATANAIALSGATPVFADIADDLNIDPASVERLIGPRTKAILPVHYTGKICRVPEIRALCERYGLLLIEDAAQAYGAMLDGRVAGAFGDLACFSMNAMKVLAGLGDAGMVLTDSDELKDRLVALRYNGTINREVCVQPSINGRLDTLQAAILLVRMDRVPAIIERRREIAAWYSRRLAGIVDVPVERPGERDIYYTYQIRSAERDALKAHLEASGVEVKIQHPIAMPDQPAYREGVKAECTNARRMISRILCIPAHEKLSNTDVEYVADRIEEFASTAGKADAR
ncbi:MAG: DegT/DnrJ/EryC1/StrS family aminotransferase [Acidobacteriota bacterium]